MKKRDMTYGTGCIKSTIDGTEYKFQERSIDLPAEFSYLGAMPPVLNQGRTYKCVCYSLCSYLDWKKNTYEGDNDGGQYSVDELFSIREDKNAPGMTIKEALWYLRHNGLSGTKIKDYAMVDTVKQLKQALLVNGPLVGGLPVYSDNRHDEFWKKGGKFQGGHCITVVGYNKQGIIIRNSWGTEWCSHGHVLMPYSDFGEFFEVWTMS